MLKELENRNWNARNDTRHIEDCMMYYGIANRVAGTGENIDRVRRVFDWVVRQVQLVPPNTLAAGRVAARLCPAVRRTAAGHGHRGRGILGRAFLAVHGPLPPTRYRHRLDHLHEERHARHSPARSTASNFELEAAPGHAEGTEDARRLDLYGT